MFITIVFVARHVYQFLFSLKKQSKFGLNFFQNRFSPRREKCCFLQHGKMSCRDACQENEGNRHYFHEVERFMTVHQDLELLRTEVFVEKQVSQEYVISLCETASRKHLEPRHCIFLSFFFVSSSSLFSSYYTLFFAKNTRKIDWRKRKKFSDFTGLF